MSDAASEQEFLPPLASVEEILWVAALDLVPIMERKAWVEKMTARIEAINERRMNTPRQDLPPVERMRLGLA